MTSGGGARRLALPDLPAMTALGGRIAAMMVAGDVVALSGPLGSGKTTLARAIIAAAGYTGEVPSPTFTILETYDPPAVRLPIVHADFYRLNDPAEAGELGLDDYREGAALIAEWPEKAGGFAGESGYLGIELQVEGEGRVAFLDSGESWRERGF